MGRTFVIGDLHGCFEEAVQLLKKCDASPDDRVIFLGDLVDRGPDNDKCVELAMEREQIQGSAACVLGNHEEKHLDHIRVLEETGKLPQMPKTHEATRLQLTDTHFEYFRKLPLFIRLPEFNAACVHAGAWPGRLLDEQQKRHLLHIQMINPNESEKTLWPSKVTSNDWKFWTRLWDGPERLIFGHSVLDRPLVTEKAVGIDGGAVFGLALHALVLPEWEIVTVNAATDFGKGSRGRSNDRIRKFAVHDDVSTFS